MLKINWLIAMGVLALLPATAGAHTTIIEPPESHYPYQQWVDEAKVPTPDVTLELIEEDSRCEGEGTACAVEGEPYIWFDPTELGRTEFLHELGHEFDYLMPEWTRGRFLSLSRDPRPWRSPPNSPNEQFAEAWAACALWGDTITWRPELGYLWEPSPRLHRRVCHLIRVAARFSS